MPTDGKVASVDRRRLLQAIGAASAVGLAGCSGSGQDEGTTTEQETDTDGGDGGGDGGDLGERVPTLTFQYWSDQGPPTVLFEETISTIQAVTGDIGISLETMPMTTAEGLSAVSNDTREFHIAVNSHGPSPGRLDPNELLTNYSIDFAGANGDYNPSNYASCEFSELAEAQSTVGDPEERQSAVDDALSVYSADLPFIPTIERPTTAAINTDQVNSIESGAAGLNDVHWAALVEAGVSTAGGTDAIVANLPTEHLTSSFYPTVADGDSMGLYTSLTHNPLLMYDSDYELTPVLAEDWETSDDGTTTTFTLRDATFHNGDPVTPEDVKWTYEFLRDQYHDGDYQWTSLPESLSVEVVDDSTVAFNTDEAAPTLLTASLSIYGVLPRDPYVNAGIEDNPTDFDDPMIGAGPYRMVSYQNQQNMALEPHDGHPVYSPEADILFQLYESTDGVTRAFENGELNVAVALHPEAGQQIEESMGGNVQIITGVSHLPFGVMPQMSFAPGKFIEFRQALSHLIDRQNINETYAFGESETVTHCTFHSSAHPWHNEEVLTEIAGDSADVDQARSILEDAGWGWDDNGNLHYPPDAEMEAWPQGEEPDPEEFPCLG
ncbi:ABC transporter substrate-binding protein [Halorussus amylolyticus]|uniref:ABC transporter substrate-binding protein n=1 Tax=Halorussus amylolyticus TaxID=1126242 RepID=UPI00138F7E73|nr:ABC transporter substrate-binding protein [Halorussus amylolyticus]